MSNSDRHCHSATILVEAEPEKAYEFMADGVKGGNWALGSWDRRQVGGNLFAGTSLYDGTEIFVAVHGDRERLIVDYGAGTDPQDLPVRTMARIIPGPAVGRAPGTCLVSLISWRLERMDDDRWRRLCVSHETEMYIIKGLIEAEK